MNKFCSDIQCVILVGGFGLRLGELTKEIPKPLVKVLEKPFLVYLIDQLVSQGFHKFIFLSGYQAEKINLFLSEHYKTDQLTIKCISEPYPLGTGGAIAAASKHLEERFLLLNGDTYLPIDYGSLIAKFTNPKYEYMVGHKGPVYDELCNISTIHGRYVSSYGDSSKESSHVDCGVYLFSRSYFEKNFQENKFGLSLIYKDMIDDRCLHLVETVTPYFDIGTPQRLKRFEEFLEGNNESK
jgi:D-glycero-D-manno-heptose 1,7-bisphosphate phosphatase